MSLLRDSAMVGVATFLVGSAFMQINLTEDGKAVGWWPYVGTFLSGALGFYLIAATDVVKVKEAEEALSRGELMGQSSPGGHSIKGGHRYVECQFLSRKEATRSHEKDALRPRIFGTSFHRSLRYSGFRGHLWVNPVLMNLLKPL